MQKLQGFCEQGNTTLSITGAAGTISRKVQGSFPSCTVTVYLNSPAAAVNISSISRTSNLVTVTIPSGSNFISGESVTIASVTDSSFNGTFTIVSSGATTFTYDQTAANASSSGGTAQSNLRLANIYSDDDLTAKANPFTASSDGTWFFYVANGRYDVKFSGGGISSPFTISDFFAFHAVSGTTSAIATGATVTHGLGATPSQVLVTAADSGPTNIYTTSKGATTFIINYGGGGTHVFDWMAIA